MIKEKVKQGKFFRFEDWIVTKTDPRVCRRIGKVEARQDFKMSLRTVINLNDIDFNKAVRERRLEQLTSFINAEGVEVITYQDNYGKAANGRQVNFAGAVNCAKMEDKRQNNIARLRAKLAARKKA